MEHERMDWSTDEWSVWMDRWTDGQLTFCYEKQCQKVTRTIDHILC